MEGLINLFENVSQSDHGNLLRALDSFKQHQTFYTASHSNLVDPVIASLNSLLNTPSKKLEAFLLLETFVSECSTNILDQKGSLWLTISLKHCNPKQNPAVVSVAAKVISELIKRSLSAPDFGKTLSSNMIPKIIDIAINCHSDAGFFQITKPLLQHYPGQCGSSRQTILKKLWTYVDSVVPEWVQETARCHHLLQQVRGGGIQGISHKNMWTQYQLQLIGSLHEYLNLLFANTFEASEFNQLPDRLNVPELKLDDVPITKASQLSIRIENLITYLRIMLLDPFPTTKSVHAVKIINLIARGLSVNCTTLSKNAITDNLAVGLMLPNIHVKLMNLLDSLIYISGTNLLPYTKTITQVLIQSLQWTSVKTSKKPYTAFRIATYTAFKSWYQISHYNTQFELIAEQLVESILVDIRTLKTEVTLQVLQGARKHMSKKARRNLQKVQNENSHITKDFATNVKSQKVELSDGDDDVLLCAKALDCLADMILECGTFLKPNIHKVLQETIVIMSYEVVNGNAENMGAYKSWQCRINLLRCLTNLVISSHSLVPAPLQYALQILVLAAKRDGNRNVQLACKSYLSSLEKIIHPQKETLEFKKDSDDESDEENDIDERNIDIENSITFMESEIGEIGNDTTLRMSVSPLASPEKIPTSPVQDISKNELRGDAVTTENAKNDEISNNQEAAEVITHNVDEINNKTEDIEIVEDANENNITKKHETGVVTPIKRSASNKLETIEIDSNDDDEIQEIQDTAIEVVEPLCKKIKIGELTTDSNIINCDDILEEYASAFNDELNEQIIIE